MAVESPAEVPVPLALANCDVGTRCCTMVLFTTNLNCGSDAPEVLDSEVRALRIEA